MTQIHEDQGLGRRRLLGASIGAVGGAIALGALAASPAEAAASDAEFWSYGPRRVVDSRIGQGTTTGKISAGETRTISLSTVFSTGFDLTAVMNITVTKTTNSGFLTLWQSGQSRPNVSTINWWGSNQTYGNLAIVGLRKTPVSFDVFCGGGNGATHILVDVLGYFYRSGAAAQNQAGVEKR